MSNLSNLSNTQIITNGLWYNNPAIVQLLGLCPLLAVSNTTINAFTLGISTIIVLVFCNTIIAALKHYIDHKLRIAYFMLIISSIVSFILIIMQSYTYELYKTLGVYLALITTNCIILARIEAFAYKTSITKAFIDGLFTGIGFFIVLIILGSIREIIGQATLFANFNQLFGSIANNWTISLKSFNINYSFIIAILPPGAFITLGLLIALKNYLSNNSNQSNQPINKKPIAYELPATLSSIPKIPRKKS